MATAINAAAAEGWEYLRADILPSEERQGLTSTHTVYRSVLVFRRDLAETGPRPAPRPASGEPASPPSDTAPGDGEQEETPATSYAYAETPGTDLRDEAFDDHPGESERSRP